jgi:DNA repair exonuclease SbcCD nuclease subunit
MVEEMERTKRTKIADAILTADLHLSLRTPIARTDDYPEAQKRKLQFIQELSYKNNFCPILCSGDIFDRWNSTAELCSWAFDNLPKNIIAIPGNHDLPLHSLDQYKKSSLYLLDTVQKIIVLKNEGL